MLGRSSWRFHPLRARIPAETLSRLPRQGRKVGASDIKGRGRASSGIPRILYMGEHHIHAAAKTGDLGELRALIAEDRRCAYDEDDYSMTPLIWAAYGGYTQCVRLLLDSGAKVNHRERNGDTALHRACLRGYRDVVALLLRHGADVNIRGWLERIPLITAAFMGHPDVVYLLIIHGGSDINSRGCDGQTALWCSVADVSPDIVRQLLHARADPGIANREGVRPMALAMIQAAHGCRRLLQDWERSYLLTKIRHVQDAIITLRCSDVKPLPNAPLNSGDMCSKLIPAWLRERNCRGGSLPSIEGVDMAGIACHSMSSCKDASRGQTEGGGAPYVQSDANMFYGIGQSDTGGEGKVAQVAWYVVNGLKYELFVELMEAVGKTSGW